MNTLQAKKYYLLSRVIEQVKFSYFPLGKAFKKQIKTVKVQEEKQIKALEEHGKQLVKYSNEKGSSAHSKQKRNFWKTC